MMSYMVHTGIINPREHIITFFDAELPGNFVKGMKDFFDKDAKSTCEEPSSWERAGESSFDWLASSLLPCNENTALEDVYGFYRDEPFRWLMNEKISGDVTDINTFEYHSEYINEYTSRTSASTTSREVEVREDVLTGVDMYICDLGIHHDNTNFHIQEKRNIKPQICAVLKGMSILKEGGTLLCKIFSCLEEDTRRLLSMVQFTFKKTLLCKPSSSRGRNKELYIIATGYQKRYTHKEIKKAFLEQKPIYDDFDMCEEYDTIVYASQFFTFRQLTWLEKMKQGPLETTDKKYEKYAEDYINYLGVPDATQ